MKKTIHAAFVALGAAISFGCVRDAAQLLKMRADIDLTSTNATVSLVDRKDLDQVAYSIAFDEGSEHGLREAIENASGGLCWEFVASGEGCHYRSKSGRDVFLSKAGPRAFLIYTSG